MEPSAPPQDPILYLNFGIFKKNNAGKYQYRKLQFDFKAQCLWNIKGETEKELRAFKFTDIKALEREPNNPLSFKILFKSRGPYLIYAQSRVDADLMSETIEDIVSNGKSNRDSVCNLYAPVIKMGPVLMKIQLGWQRRWIALHKWQMICKRDDFDTKPVTVRSLYHVPIAKYPH